MSHPSRAVRRALVAGRLALFAGAAWAAPAQAVDVNALPRAVERTLQLQPYEVCDDAGLRCALGGAATNFTRLMEQVTVANAILNQAGIGVAVAPIVQLRSTRFLDTQTDGTNFDELRDLVRLPANAPATTGANTLNVWFVNTLTNVTNPAAPSPFYGFGLFGGNGAAVATGRDAGGRTAAADTLAHELAHNLGLLHPEDPPARPATQDGLPWNSPRNLMRSVGRDVVSAATLCAVPPYTCATGTAAANSRGVLVRDQVQALRAPPIFTALPQVRTLPREDSLANILTLPQGGGGGLSLSPVLLLQDRAATAGLVAVSWRFRGVDGVTHPTIGFESDEDGILRFDGTNLVPPSTTSLPLPQIRSLTTTFANNNATLEVRFDAPLDPRYRVSAGFLTRPTVLTAQGMRPYDRVEDGCCFFGNDLYSVQYTFETGITSRAGFDASGFGSGDGAFLGFDPLALGVVRGPSVLPREIGAFSPVLGGITELHLHTNFAPPGDPGRIAAPLAALDRLPPTPSLAVPVPAALALFAPAALAMLGLARRRRAAWRRSPWRAPALAGVNLLVKQ